MIGPVFFGDESSGRVITLKLKVEEIPSDGLDLREILDNDCLKRISQDCKAMGGKLVAPISLNMRVTKSERGVFLRGIIDTDLVMTCSRCLKEFDFPIVSDFKYTFCPAEDQDITDDLELSSEDLRFSFYLGEEIDLCQVILEQIMLAIPFKHLCHDLCLGLCHQCGKDLNIEECECSKQKTFNIAFSELQDLKLNR